jgi:hypothetical protein
MDYCPDFGALSYSAVILVDAVDYWLVFLNPSNLSVLRYSAFTSVGAAALGTLSGGCVLLVLSWLLGRQTLMSGDLFGIGCYVFTFHFAVLYCIGLYFNFRLGSSN